MRKILIVLIAMFAGSQSLAHVCDPAEQDKETGFYGSFLQLESRQMLTFPDDNVYFNTEKQLQALHKDCPNLQDPKALALFDSKFMSKCDDSCHNLAGAANKDDTFFKKSRTNGTEYECKTSCEIAYYKDDAYSAGLFRGQSLCAGAKSTAKRPLGNGTHLCDPANGANGFGTVYMSLGDRKMLKTYEFDIGANVDKQLSSLQKNCPNLKDPDAMSEFNQKLYEKCNNLCHSVSVDVFKDKTLFKGSAINSAESGCKTACLINHVENEEYSIGLREGQAACSGATNGSKVPAANTGDR